MENGAREDGCVYGAMYVYSKDLNPHCQSLTCRDPNLDRLVAALDAPVGPLAASCPPPPETQLVCVHGLPEGHPRRAVLGVYVRVPEEVRRRRVTPLPVSPSLCLAISPLGGAARRDAAQADGRRAALRVPAGGR